MIYSWRPTALNMLAHVFNAYNFSFILIFCLFEALSYTISDGLLLCDLYNRPLWHQKIDTAQ